MTRVVRPALLAVAVLASCGERAYGQTMDHAHGIGGQVAAGAEVTGVLGQRDNDAFFNYTDYHTNALRVGRIRLFGEWRPIPDRVSFVAELRTEDATDVQAPALYLRWRPAAGHDFFIQAGRVPPVIGAFPRRAYGRDNAVVGLPLMYQYLTSLRPDALPATRDDLLRMRGRGWQPSFPVGSSTSAPGISLLSVSRWDTGVEGAWSNTWLDVAAALTQGSPAAPVVSDRNDGRMVSGRVGFRLPAGVTLGMSAGRGAWIDNAVLSLAPHGTSSPSTQTIAATDFEWGLGPWLVRSEWVRSTFEIPVVSDPTPDVRLAAWAGFIEARYQLATRWQAGMRVDRLRFSTLTGTTINAGLPTPWDGPVDRAEATLGFRASRHIEVRAGYQYNWRSAGRVRTRGFPALAALYWF